MKAYIPAEDVAQLVDSTPVDDLLLKVLSLGKTLQSKGEDRFVWMWKDVENEYVTTLTYDEWKKWNLAQRSRFVQALLYLGHTAGITEDGVSVQ
jgi:hypothetical protein